MNTKETSVHYRHEGFCPICEYEVQFASNHAWYRDHLFCSECGSIPRERAFALVLNRIFPNWRELAIHESSPIGRGISLKMRRECKGYVASQFFPNENLGALVGNFRNENLESQSFESGRFDVVATLDVMEHVNEPEACFTEIRRTLKDGGAYLFTVPTYKGKTTSERRARYNADGTIEHFAKPEYHGNPVSDEGSLVTFHYGYDLPDLINQWSGMEVEVIRFHSPKHGIIGEFTEMYCAFK